MTEKIESVIPLLLTINFVILKMDNNNQRM